MPWRGWPLKHAPSHMCVTTRNSSTSTYVGISRGTPECGSAGVLSHWNWNAGRDWPPRNNNNGRFVLCFWTCNKCNNSFILQISHYLQFKHVYCTCKNVFVGEYSCSNDIRCGVNSDVIQNDVSEASASATALRHDVPDCLRYQPVSSIHRYFIRRPINWPNARL